MDFLHIPLNFLQHLNVFWTFFLLLTRFHAMMAMLPGIGMGERGMIIRIPATIVLSFTALSSGVYAPLPDNWALLVSCLVSEMLFGILVGLIPLFIISGMQTAGYLSSTTMGLGAGNLIDPTLGMGVSSLARILGDLTIVIFLMLDGHHIIINAVAGMNGTIVPGSFVPTEVTMDLLISRSADIFRIGAMVAAPVIVALLLTQFVLGMISKAVPTVNIFIISFPLTIGIGLVLTSLALPEAIGFVSHELTGIESSVMTIVGDTQRPN
jgi:flagellar biosynthetic protein FliR